MIESLVVCGDQILPLSREMLILEGTVNQLAIMNIASIGIITELSRTEAICPLKATRLINGLTVSVVGLMDEDAAKSEIKIALRQFNQCPTDEMVEHPAYRPIINYLAQAA